MKKSEQAVLITAYKNFHHLEEIISHFGTGFSIYIHIDKKINLSALNLKKLQNYKNVEFISQKYKVNWGGLNHTKAILLLAEQALLKQDNFYFHLISGHDFPIRQKSEFVNFFEENRQNNYINYFDVPKPGWANNGGIDRLIYYNFYDLLNWKNTKQKMRILKILAFQKKIGFRRSFSKKMPKLYGGSTWWSLNRHALEYVMDYVNSNKFFLRRFKYTLCSEEFFFQTILLNSPLRSTIENMNLRYIDWTYKNGNSPAILDNSDFDRIKSSKAFFARKFEYPVSEPLLRNLKANLYA